MPDKPNLEPIKGLRWDRRRDHWVALWVAPKGLRKKGFETKSVRLWPPTKTPLIDFAECDAVYIRAECQRLNKLAVRWAGGEPEPFKRTLHGLIQTYQTDPDSPFHALRHKSKRHYGYVLAMIDRQLGTSDLPAITGRHFRHWYDKWAEPKIEGGKRRVGRAHTAMTMLRIIFSFGAAILEDSECQRLFAILEKLEFQAPRARKQTLNRAHAVAVRKQAHLDGYPSVALQQAFEFDLGVRPKDVGGEWLPISEPGLSTVHDRGDKWLYGIDWREISPTLILTHRLSKSLRGRDAITDPHAGKTKVWNLKLYPMIMEELARIPPEQRAGPLIKDERTGLPYANGSFGTRWRTIANRAGVPKAVQHRDTRAGMISETIELTGGDLEAARKAAGHARIETTLIYSREDERNDAMVARVRAAAHEPTTNVPTNSNQPTDDESKA